MLENTNDVFGGSGSWFIIILFLFAFFGFGGNGFGNNGAAANYTLASDFANISRQIDNSTDRLAQQTNQIANGLCDGFYTQAQLVNGLNTNILQNGYAIQNQLSNGFYNVTDKVQANTTQGILNTNSIQNQIQQCCCANEKDSMQTRFDMAQYNCSTLQAIDKLGDRIIDYMASDKVQALRDENYALKLAASQAAQNTYLVSQLKA